ncbi:hypothetical protein FG93_04821 [Bosea sp. LC85]|nr:hypothetical protein FG93_04821 [Bosea sp. LC85]
MFTQWVGPQFGAVERALASKRLLVVGESHHAEEHPVGSVVPNMTLDVFKQYRTGPWAPWMRTFDNIAAAVNGRSKTELGREGFNGIWDEIAFYNYIPVVAASAARQRPSPDHFAAGATAVEARLGCGGFLHCLNKLIEAIRAQTGPCRCRI